MARYVVTRPRRQITSRQPEPNAVCKYARAGIQFCFAARHAPRTATPQRLAIRRFRGQLADQFKSFFSVVMADVQFEQLPSESLRRRLCRNRRFERAARGCRVAEQILAGCITDGGHFANLGEMPRLRIDLTELRRRFKRPAGQVESTLLLEVTPHCAQELRIERIDLKRLTAKCDLLVARFRQMVERGKHAIKRLEHGGRAVRGKLQGAGVKLNSLHDVSQGHASVGHRQKRRCERTVVLDLHSRQMNVSLCSLLLDLFVMFALGPLQLDGASSIDMPAASIAVWSSSRMRPVNSMPERRGWSRSRADLLGGDLIAGRRRLDHYEISAIVIGLSINQCAESICRFGGQRLARIEPKNPIAGGVLKTSISRGGEVVAPRKVEQATGALQRDFARAVGRAGVDDDDLVGDIAARYRARRRQARRHCARSLPHSGGGGGLVTELWTCALPGMVVWQ